MMIVKLMRMGGVMFGSLLRIRKYRVGLSLVLAEEILLEDGVYVSQPLRYIEFDPDVAIKRFGPPEDCINDVNIYRKNQ